MALLFHLPWLVVITSHAALLITTVPLPVPAACLGAPPPACTGTCAYIRHAFGQHQIMRTSSIHCFNYDVPLLCPSALSSPHALRVLLPKCASSTLHAVHCHHGSDASIPTPLLPSLFLCQCAVLTPPHFVRESVDGEGCLLSGTDTVC